MCLARWHGLKSPLFAQVSQVAYQREIILVCGDAKPTASSANGLNTILQLRALRLHHILYLSDSAASCASLRMAVPDVACVWSSRIAATRPRNGGLCVQLYWGYAFYFYDLRKYYTARMATELGVNVLQTDTDVVWLANPYPALKQVFGGVQIIAMSDRPMINAGVLYVQDVRPGDGASWVLRELSRRIHSFLLRPSTVHEYIPWAQPPYFANVDEQTLMNDVVRSSITNVVSFAQATAGWEVKRHRTGTLMNKSFAWKTTPECALPPPSRTGARREHRRTSSSTHVSMCLHSHSHPSSTHGSMCLRIDVSAAALRAHSRAPLSSLRVRRYRLVRWLDRHVAVAGRRMALPAPVRVHEVCGSVIAHGVGTVYPLHYVGGADRSSAGKTTAVAMPRASLAIGPPWLFMHLPSNHAAAGIRKCRVAQNASGVPATGQQASNETRLRPPSRPAEHAAPFIMGHLAGIRTGAWSRRALMRAYGWWLPDADLLIARQLGWGARRHTLSLFGVGTPSALPMLRTAVRSQAHLDMLMANLLLLGRLVGRRPVLPEVDCGSSGTVNARRGYGTRPVAARPSSGAQTCAWMPPKPCWSMEYLTELEAERLALTVEAGQLHSQATPPGNGTACDGLGRGLLGALPPSAVALRAAVTRLACEPLAHVPLIAADNADSTSLLEQLISGPLVPAGSRTQHMLLTNVTNASARHVASVQGEVACLDALYQYGSAASSG